MHDWRTASLLGHVAVEASTLHHEIVDDAVKNRSVVMLVLDVLKKILNCLGSLVGINLDHDVAGAGRQLDTGSLLRRRHRGGECQQAG